jgi:hypothetical protein
VERGRSKHERINVKMELAPAWGRGRQKGYWVKGVRAGKQGYTGAFSAKYTPVLRARGVLNTVYLFF